MSESWCAHWVCNQWKSQTGRLWLSLFIESLLSSPLLSSSFNVSFSEVKVMNLNTFLWENYPSPPPRLSIFPQRKENQCTCWSLHFKSYPNKQKYTWCFHGAPSALLFFSKVSEAWEVEGWKHFGNTECNNAELASYPPGLRSIKSVTRSSLPPPSPSFPPPVCEWSLL